MVELGLYIRRNLSYSIRNYSSLVACTLLFYEFLTTLHLEVSLIWSKPLTFPKLVFLVCRYFALSFQTAVAMSNQVILSTLLIYPKIIRVTKRRPAWVAVMTRDALATFSVVGVLLALIIAAAETVAHVMPSAFITILSVSGCRMTSNLLCSAAEQLRDEPPPRCATVYSEGIQLTSFLSLEGDVPSLRHDLRSSVSSSSHPPSSRPSFHPEMIYESSVP
ncbi:hypothetical protein ONZ45_g2678 [Pleurotus djamor]|nr:hypothetical protein ONZ45_g2678 [Pleurotus djamor]